MLYRVKSLVHIPEGDAAAREDSRGRDADSVVNSNIAAERGGYIIQENAFQLGAGEDV